MATDEFTARSAFSEHFSNHLPPVMSTGALCEVEGFLDVPERSVRVQPFHVGAALFRTVKRPVKEHLRAGGVRRRGLGPATRSPIPCKEAMPAAALE